MGLLPWLKGLIGVEPNLPDDGPAEKDETEFEQELDENARAEDDAP